MTLPTATSDVEELEGLDTDEDSAWGDYPIDTVLIRHENRTVHDVLRRVEQQSFIMNPDFQRDFIWPDDKQSKLIESVLMRIPLPVFYLAENPAGQMIVVDGLQRLSTFQRFVANRLKLRLPEQSELDGKTFKTLSPKLQNRIEDCNLILYVIDAKVPERARLDIFERVNSGVPLTRQQMRNCLYMGQATAFVKNEAHTSIFRRATGGSLKSSTMRDREFVNRYCAFRLLGIEAYRGDMDDFLAASLRKMNGLTEEQLSTLSRELRLSLEQNWSVFRMHAFRKHTSANAARSVLNASLWDVMSTGFADLREPVSEARAEALRQRFYRLMSDSDFVRAVTYSTNSVNRVRERFAIWSSVLAEVFHD